MEIPKEVMEEMKTEIGKYVIKGLSQEEVEEFQKTLFPIWNKISDRVMTKAVQLGGNWTEKEMKKRIYNLKIVCPCCGTVTQKIKLGDQP